MPGSAQDVRETRFPSRTGGYDQAGSGDTPYAAFFTTVETSFPDKS
jgi:hypothetical protein